MSPRLQDKVAIVTGSSSGLGRAIAVRYAKEGAKVVCADLTPTARSEEEAVITTHELILRNGGSAIFVPTDVGNATQVENLVTAAVQAYGRLDMYAYMPLLSMYCPVMLTAPKSSQQCRNQYRGTNPSRASLDG